MKARTISFGANLVDGGCDFRVWAPNANRVTLRLLRNGGHEDVPMLHQRNGEFAVTAKASAGERYFYIVDDNQPVPDPVSRLLPEGVHGPTQIVDQDSFAWSDDGWRGLSLLDYVIYELHVGTFTPEGTFDAVIGKLDYVKRLGVTVIEIMPVAAFPGGSGANEARNWGYDGVSPYAVQASYGGPEGLKRLVDAAHARGLAVMLDVVYNHLGNEGNYLRQFGPYFTGKHKTPWGEAVNYDQQGSDGVRRYVIENALYWISEYHLDGLRLDAVQTIHDDSNRHILAEITENVQALATELGRKVCVIAESDENDAKLVRPRSQGGYGLDAVWSDDFHHAVHAFLTRERAGYYQDFGAFEQIGKALEEGFVFQGEHFNFWNRPRGTSAEEVPLPAHVICVQNHDQIGNRAQGKRLKELVGSDAAKVAAALLLLAPHTPLLFMGQEFGEERPFQFFTSYGDPHLKQAVQKGRREEFKDFAWDDVPDPEDPKTYLRSKLDWSCVNDSNDMLVWYTELLALRKRFVMPFERTCAVEMREGILRMRVPAKREFSNVLVLATFSEAKLPPPLDNDWKAVIGFESERGSVAAYTRGPGGEL